MHNLRLFNAKNDLYYIKNLFETVLINYKISLYYVIERSILEETFAKKNGKATTIMQIFN